MEFSLNIKSCQINITVYYCTVPVPTSPVVKSGNFLWKYWQIDILEDDECSHIIMNTILKGTLPNMDEVLSFPPSFFFLFPVTFFQIPFFKERVRSRFLYREPTGGYIKYFLNNFSVYEKSQRFSGNQKILTFVRKNSII